MKLYATYAILNRLEEAEKCIDEIFNKFSNHLGDKMFSKITKDKEMILNRRKANEFKEKADFELKSKNLTEAKALYATILNYDKTNDKVLSNMALISLKDEDYYKAISYCSDILKNIKKFKDNISSSFKMDLNFEIKILLRRAKAYEQLNDLDKSIEDISQCERLEISSKAIVTEIDKIKKSIKTKIIEKLKITANVNLKNKNFSEALTIYDKILQMNKFNNSNLDKIETLKIMLNRTSCLLKLEQYDNAINECTRIFSQLNKQKNIAVLNSNLNQKQIIDNLEVVCLNKRAYAFSQIEKYLEAKSDYESILKVDPFNKDAKENYSKIIVKYF